MPPKIVKIANAVAGAEQLDTPPGDAQTSAAAADPGSKPKPKVVDFMVGLRKRGPRAYSIVYGRIEDGVPNFVVEEVAQPLEFAAVELREVLRKTVEIIP